MLDSAFDLPLVVTGLAIIGGLCAFAIAGLLGVRRHLLPRLGIRPEDSEFTGAMVQAIMVFYGLAVALIAVSVWQNYSDVSRIVSEEATTLAALYRDVSGYPDPIRGALRDSLRDYVENVIEEAWPIQHAGGIPTGGVERMNAFQAILIAFEPGTDGQESLHSEALRAYNQMIHARRLRLDATLGGLPGLLWVVIVAGALISLCSTFFFAVADVRLHAILVVLLASFVGLVIFMIFALDRPFRGDLGIPPDAYRLVYDQLMRR